jgi:hypothetical protein
MIEIYLDKNLLSSLDLSPVKTVIDKLTTSSKIIAAEQQFRFQIDFPREPTDPRELSEFPEIRLWFARLDSVYPWMPFFLDWKSGELARYAAMLVPHQFSPTEGIQYNPEALEIFVIKKIFVLLDWLRQLDIPNRFRAKSMAQLFGYDLDDSLFELIEARIKET